MESSVVVGEVCFLNYDSVCEIMILVVIWDFRDWFNFWKFLFKCVKNLIELKEI